MKNFNFKQVYKAQKLFKYNFEIDSYQSKANRVAMRFF